MRQIIFATGNNQKFLLAKTACNKYGIAITQEPHLEIAELQNDDGEPIARHKAVEAFKILQKPVVVTDDAWIIPGLNGFPGPYMKSVSHWFRIEDWLNLTKPLTDRRVFLRQILVYQDAHEQMLFSIDVEGLLLRESRGTSANTNQPITSFDDGKHSVAEIAAQGKSATAHKQNSWDQFCAWFATKTNA